ncbi:MAG: hypothetical protein JO015_17140 [Verrucomicrobia bacterium]|nr:hypothetical protein [Verrucomicrobiota bacterium]
MSSRSKRDAPPPPGMVEAVNQMFRQLEALAPDPNVAGICPELPGIVLQRIKGQALDPQDKRYLDAITGYQSAHDDFMKALVAHPIGRALALLAVGPDGVALMEAGRTPNTVTGISHADPRRPARSSRQAYNCHHVIPKSVSLARGQNINHPGNLVVAKTLRRGRDQSENPHHFWHGLLLHPQLHRAPPHEIPIYVVRPLFPFYPPANDGFRSVEELRAKLKQLGAPPLPETWEKRILAFSAATRHRPYRVPERYQRITQMFGDLFTSEKRDDAAQLAARADLANRAAAYAAEFLPAGAYLNGNQLPTDHQPKHQVPVVDIDIDLSPVAKASKTPARRQATSRAQAKARAPKPQSTRTPGVKI